MSRLNPERYRMSHATPYSPLFLIGTLITINKNFLNKLVMLQYVYEKYKSG
jgi:hypothetical protein